MARKPGKGLWIIGAAAVTALIIGGCANGLNPDSDKDNAASASQKGVDGQTASRGIKGGTYKIGTDIPAGEYVIVGSGYLQVTSDSTGNFESIIANDNYKNRTIISVTDGQYLKFSGEAAYPFDDAPKPDVSQRELPEGKYKVGADIQPGEYKLIPSGSGYYAVSDTPDDKLTNLVDHKIFSTEVHVTVSAGQYLKINRAILKL